jgi:lantibiotic modifying enzyme
MSQPANQFLETADYLGTVICRDALWAGQRCNWLGPSMEYVNGTWTVVQRAYGSDLYGGAAGISLFLTHLYVETKEKIYRTTAAAGFRQAITAATNFQRPVQGAFYSGSVGIAYALLDAAALLAHDEYVAEALHLLERLTPEDQLRESLDVISGSAGAIPALLDMHRSHPHDLLLRLALKYGEHLLSTANRGSIGWSWSTLNTERDLTGFSHGTAGIGWALLELYHRTREERFRVGAEEAFRYERHWYNSEQVNWPDFRGFTNQNPSAPLPCALAWCHGAPGIGLSRLRAYELTGDQIYRDEAETAVRTTARMLLAATQAGGENFSLCHGLSGNAELLIYARRVLRDDSHVSLVEQIVSRDFPGLVEFPRAEKHQI